ncbi:LiaF transmembrane domain-containing protein [Deefgea piscis]|nr:DUF5668 domain-containing protein [Deefgea piscis]
MMRHKYFSALLLVALGLLFLAHNFGFLPSFGQMWALWWPLVLIIVGVNLLFRRPKNKDDKDE